ncbi:MAG: HD domain-containing protein [Candidatus Bathyarchaeota archaeon]|nr:HD domain-containing protein [Candidatus Bathyarchaeum tardum]WGM90541.1 MAG: HD domain-containing protein [Candidatus Bathyarchaeum tardum]
MDDSADSSPRDIIKFLEASGTLKRIQRTGWVDVGVFDPESVADHTFRTAILCMLYADMNGLDTLKLLKMVLIHDLPEAIIGDLMPSQKTARTKQDEEAAIRSILDLLPKTQRDNYLSIWVEYKQGKTKEAKAVLQLDKIEMALQAKEYEKLGHESECLERFITSAKQFSEWPDIKRLLACILEEKQ